MRVLERRRNLILQKFYGANLGEIYRTSASVALVTCINSVKKGVVASTFVASLYYEGHISN